MVRSALLNHRFYENIESALHITQIPIETTFDVINFENGQWHKRRWEHKKQKRLKRTEDENGYVEYVEVFGSVYLQKEFRILKKREAKVYEASLLSMDAAIDHILDNPSDDLYHRAMMYEAAYRQHQLAKYRSHIEEFKSFIHYAIGDTFNVDMSRTIFRLVCAEVWSIEFT